MTSDILETITKEKLLLKKWSQQVEELEQFEISDQQNKLCENLKENIKNKMQMIEDLEFEALENQILLEESQQKSLSSSSPSSPNSHSIGSDFISATSFASEDSCYINDDRIVTDPCSNDNRGSWMKLQRSITQINLNPSKEEYDRNGSNDDEVKIPSNTKFNCTDTLRQQCSTEVERLSSTSFEQLKNEPSIENDNSNFSRHKIQSLSVRSRLSFKKKQNNSRPLTRFLPAPKDPRFNLRYHIEQCGHNLSATENTVKIDTHTCYGLLFKLSGNRFKIWKKKYFIFDRNRRIFAYYAGSTSTKMKGVISFDQILNVQAITERPSKLDLFVSSDAKHIFSVQLIDSFNRGRTFKEEIKLSAPSAESQRIWMDVLFTGAEGYSKTLDDNRNQLLTENSEFMVS